MRALMITVLMLAGFASGSSAQSKLKIELTNLSEKGGNVYIALFDSPENFMKNRVAGVILKTSGPNLSTEVGLADGEYAIMLYQDENGNGRLDQGVFGIPKEKYGFSNNVKPTMGPPSFKACKFAVKGDTVVKIAMR